MPAPFPNTQFHQAPQESLQAAGFNLLTEYGHHDMLPFLRTYLRKWNKSMLSFRLLNLLIAATAFWRHVPYTQFNDWMFALSFGLLGAFVLIPVHEWLHVLAFKYLGATQTYYGANFKRFYFYAGANLFVANKPGFRLVALLPCCTIGLLLLLGMLWLPFHWQLTAWSVLLWHTSMCAGDFALLSFYESHPQSEIVTWDDRETQQSHFYHRPLS